MGVTTASVVIFLLALLVACLWAALRARND